MNPALIAKAEGLRAQIDNMRAVAKRRKDIGALEGEYKYLKNVLRINADESSVKEYYSGQVRSYVRDLGLDLRSPSVQYIIRPFIDHGVI